MWFIIIFENNNKYLFTKIICIENVIILHTEAIYADKSEIHKRY